MTEGPSLAALEQKVAEILELPEPDQPAAFEELRLSHPEHGELLREWEARLSEVPGPKRSVDTTEKFAEIARDASAGDGVGDRIGPYRILETLGEGGMGTVYIAEQREPVRRRVALKVIKLGMDSKSVVARFEQERQALAVMEHDAIAKIFDCGRTKRGQPYFVMEYVKGLPITQYCDEHKLGVLERLELFLQVCAGVHHAHGKRVVHRDLTANNVLVSEQDGAARVKIIDFGLARATDHHLVEATVFTEQGTIVGTPEYMSPEQAGRGAAEIDARTDVYSLGVLLYKLLTGQLPFARERLRDGGWFEMQRIIREEEPPRPSTRVARAASTSHDSIRSHGIDPRALRTRLKDDLDWIVMKAIEKDRVRRYQNARELAEDIERHLRHEPVTAGPPSIVYQASKFLRRRRVAVLVAGLLLIAMGAIGIAVWLRADQYALARKVQGILRDADLNELEAACRELEASNSPESRRLLRACRSLMELADRARAMGTAGPAAPGADLASLRSSQARSSGGVPPPWRDTFTIEEAANYLGRNKLTEIEPVVPPSIDPEPTLQLAGLFIGLDQYELAEKYLARIPDVARSSWLYRSTDAVLQLRRDFNTGEEGELAELLESHRTRFEGLLAELDDLPALREHAPLLLYNLAEIAAAQGDEERAKRLRKEVAAHDLAPEVLKTLVE